MECADCKAKDARIKELEAVAESAAYVCQSAQVEDKLKDDEIFHLACVLTGAGIPAPGVVALADEPSLHEREAHDHLDRDRAADVAALVKLSEFLTTHGRRQMDASSVDAVIRWVGELQGAVLAGDALI